MATKEQNRLIIKAARQGRLEGDTGVKATVQEALRMQLDLDFKEKPYYRSALWEATWKNHESIVKYLVEKGASVGLGDYQGRTPLHEAAYYGHVNLVEYFIEKGAPIDEPDIFGQTPVFRAADGNRHDVVELLVKRRAHTNVVDCHDVTVQHCAAFQGLPQMSNWLLYHGAWKNRFMNDDPTKRKDGKGVAQEAAQAAIADEAAGEEGEVAATAASKEDAAGSGAPAAAAAAAP
eukprot:TRINITY_DN72325_c0_g1_i1.p1 TRINITY_DN72325_c0_g1~~TRINITY_DN72325_c0_g1_i1.p1  ORF type:complete len:234 (-),score=68.09 TRINITY_DN72325_c0_g1_i1:180-881(-)